MNVYIMTFALTNYLLNQFLFSNLFKRINRIPDHFPDTILEKKYLQEKSNEAKIEQIKKMLKLKSDHESSSDEAKTQESDLSNQLDKQSIKAESINEEYLKAHNADNFSNLINQQLNIKNIKVFESKPKKLKSN